MEPFCVWCQTTEHDSDCPIAPKDAEIVRLREALEKIVIMGDYGDVGRDLSAEYAEAVLRMEDTDDLA